MNTRQKNKMQSHHTRLQLLKSAPEIALIKGMPAKLESYSRKFAELEDLKRSQSERSRLAGIRDASYTEMRDAALAVSGVALSYAEEKEVPGLADQVRLLPSDFLQARWADRIEIAQQLHAAVLPLVPQLADYGVTDETLDGFQAKIDAAKAALAPLRGAEVEKRAVTETIDLVLRKLDLLEKNQILPLLLPLKKSAPEVYRRYLISREIVDRPGTRSGGDKSDETPDDEKAEAGTTVATASAKDTPAADAQPKAA